MLKLMKRLSYLIVFYSGYYHIVCAINRILDKKGFTILMYHKITKDNAKFESQIKYLHNNYEVITFDELLKCYKNTKKLSKNTAIITFDDGYKDNYTVAYPILKKYNLPATIFLTTGHIDNNELLWWDKVSYIISKTKIKKVRLEGLGNFSLSIKEKAVRKIQKKLKNLDNDKKNSLLLQLEKELKVKIPKSSNLFLSWNNVKEMSMNNISFGAHTVSHPILTRMSFNQAKHEIINSKNQIERVIDKKVSLFAYPNGTIRDMSTTIDEFLKKAGFKFALSTVYGLNKLGSFRLKRIGIDADDDIRLFRIKLLGIGRGIAPLYMKLL